MPYYRVVLHAFLPPSPPGSDLDLRGFYVTRVVDAAGEAEAGAAAIRLVHGEPKFARMAEAYGAAPELQVYRLEPDPAGDPLAANRSGYVFHEGDEP
jgi:hypothetical protein